MSAAKPRVVLVEDIHPSAVAHFEHAGFEVEQHAQALPQEELVRRVKDAVFLGIRSNTHLDASFFAEAPDLLAVGAFCVGTNQIDVAAASMHGVAVFNAPFSNTRSVVELEIAEIMALNRRLTDKNTEMHKGVWDKSAKGAYEVRGQKLGIVGYGNIGAQLSVVAEGLGMEVYYFDIIDKLAMGNARKCETLEELLETVDIVTVHIEGSGTNRSLFGKEQFAQMRSGAMFINSSRGRVVDAEALAAAVKSGHLSGVAVDVFPEEPDEKMTNFVSPLQGLSNVILTPHIGGSTEEAQTHIGDFVARKLLEYYKTGGTALSINIPSLTGSPFTGAYRLLYIHQHVPHILAKVNALLAECDADVVSQQSNTYGNLGYLIIDVDKALDNHAVAAFRALPETIRCRILDSR